LIFIFVLFVIGLGLYMVNTGASIDDLDSKVRDIAKVPYLQKVNDESNGQKDVNIDDCDEQRSLRKAKACTFVVGNDNGHGSGFVITETGYMVTNYHVIDDFSEGIAKVYYDGQFNDARIVGFKVEDDLAVLKLDTTSQYCEWFDSTLLDLAETVYAIGWPNDSSGESTITKGIFSRYAEFLGAPPMIQTDTPINPGNSGGPLVNKCGVVGVNTSKLNWVSENSPSEGIGYSIQSNYAKRVIQEIIDSDDGEAEKPTVKAEQLYAEDYSGDIPDFSAPSLDREKPVEYNYEKVIFWEERLRNDKEVRSSWKEAVDSDLFDADDLSRLLAILDRMVFISDALWDGYTNSKISIGQAEYFENEYWTLNKESADISKELNYEGKINGYNACIEAWENLEEEHDKDFSEQKEECEDIID
jgi:hypothetical protein